MTFFNMRVEEDAFFDDLEGPSQSQKEGKEVEEGDEGEEVIERRCEDENAVHENQQMSGLSGCSDPLYSSQSRTFMVSTSPEPILSPFSNTDCNREEREIDILVGSSQTSSGDEPSNKRRDKYKEHEEMLPLFQSVTGDNWGNGIVSWSFSSLPLFPSLAVFISFDLSHICLLTLTIHICTFTLRVTFYANDLS